MNEEIFFNLVFISGILYLLLHLAIFIGIKLAKYFLQSDSRLKNKNHSISRDDYLFFTTDSNKLEN